MDVKTWPIEKVTPYAKNPRRIGQRAIAKVANSLKSFGWQQPIVVDKQGVVIVGHTRLLAAQSLGMTEVPVHVANLTEKKARAYRLADNRTGEESDWSHDELLAEIEALAKMDVDLDTTGFEPADLKQAPSGEKEPEAIAVKAVETGPVQDRFWISIRGPLASQAEALKRLRELMGEIAGVEVEQGTTAVEGEKDEWADFRKP